MVELPKELLAIEAKLTVGSFDMVCHVPPEVVVIRSYTSALTMPSLPSMTIELELTAKLAERSTLGGAVRVFVVLLTTFMT